MTSDGIIQRAFKKFGDRPYPYITKGQLTELQQEIVAEIKKERKHYCGDNVSRGSDFCFDYVLIDKLLGTESEAKEK